MKGECMTAYQRFRTRGEAPVVDEDARKMAMCGRKVMYAILPHAQDAARLVSKSEGTELFPYLCDYCGAYHIGHRHKKRRVS